MRAGESAVYGANGYKVTVAKRYPQCVWEEEEHRYVVTVWDRSGSSSILAQLEVSAHDEGDARRLARRLLLPGHRGRRITAERM